MHTLDSALSRGNDVKQRRQLGRARRQRRVRLVQRAGQLRARAVQRGGHLIAAAQVLLHHAIKGRHGAQAGSHH